MKGAVYAMEAQVLKKKKKTVTTTDLRCLDTVFRRPYRCFSVALKVIFSLSDGYKIFTID